MKTSTALRPGLLVSLKTSIRGNALYFRTDVEPDHMTDEGKRKARWETERIIEDPLEYERAMKIRSKSANLVRNSCIQSAFGLICPDINEQKLEQAIAQARAYIDEFNAGARRTHLSLYILVGRIAADDAEAVKAINSEIRSLMDTMEQGLRKFDVKSIRVAAEQARQVGQMLPEAAKARVREAIDAARSAANKISKAGEAAALELDQEAIRAITQRRTAFLDMDEQDTPTKDTKQSSGRALDLQESS